MAMSAGDVRIPSAARMLGGTHEPAPDGRLLVLFASVGGDGRHGPRDRELAGYLRQGGMGTLMLDLLSPDEVAQAGPDEPSFDVPAVARRFADATRWALARCGNPAIGYFGTGTAAAAALIAAADLGDAVGAVVCRSARPERALSRLHDVTAPTLFMAGEHDSLVIDLDAQACSLLHCDNELVLVPNATHHFEERGALAKAGALAADWYRRQLRSHARIPSQPGARPGHIA
jgi:pimeloyl-ACP methyl ester carboxylesterase